MKTPPFLLAAALLFWGWQTEHLLVGALVAAGVEGLRFVKWRWELADLDYHRLWDLCAIVFVGLFIFFYASEEISNSAFAFLQWLPLVFLPMIVAQGLGPRERLSYRTFSWFWRRRKGPARPEDGLHISYPYFAVCVFAASAINRRSVEFYLGVCGLAAWALWRIRPRRFPALLWVVLLLTVGAAGFAGQEALRRLQGVLENRLGNLVSLWARKDPSETSVTALGRIGHLKLSGRIVYRLRTDGQPPPNLLREASYRTLKGVTWYAAEKNYWPVSGATNDTWWLLPGKSPTRSVTIAGYLNGGRGVLPLPSGTARLERLPVLEVETNRLGVVRVANGPGLVQFQAHYEPGASIDSSPDPEDAVQIPDAERAAVDRIARELGLDGLAPDDAMQRLRHFFQGQFRYTTYQPPPTGAAATPLSRFLLTTRAGHCEYFATATVLLLRRAGIPARYAVGYAVDESPRSGVFVVRERHAHAWCLVGRNGVWEDFDTTPASWNAIEAGRAQWFEPIKDFFSRLSFEFSRFRWSKSPYRKHLVWILVPLVVALAWRLFVKKGAGRPTIRAVAKAQSAFLPGHDSEFLRIEEHLGARGLGREPGETITDWLKRIEPSTPVPLGALRPLVPLHYRQRFDPIGLDTAKRQRLRAEVSAWLEAAARPNRPAQEEQRKPRIHSDEPG